MNDRPLLIEDLEISIRTYNALINGSEARTVEELCRLTPRELLRLPGIGPITLRQINDALAEKGHALGEYSPRCASQRV